MKKNLSLIAFLLLSSISIFGQELSIDADIRPRFEYRHGFHNLVPSGVEPAAFIQQRSRLKFGYKSEKFQMHFSVQDVSIWGDTRQILPTDSNDSFQLADAWFSLAFNEKWSTKIGRQAIVYDDQRIFGGLDWAMQGRFHDAALIKFKNGQSKLDVGFAFSQDSGSGAPGNETSNLYSVTGFFSYKAMEYAHFNVKVAEKASLSVLALNTTFQNIEAGAPVEGFYHRQTFGAHFNGKFGGFGLAFNGYTQTGKANATTDLSAYLVGLETTYKAGKTLFGLGYELQSGTDQDATDGKNKSFFPVYGTNHKFNGFMDYFYVGNHANSVGLSDIYGKVVIKTGEKSSLLVKGHYFSAAATLLDNETKEADKGLGTEIDLVFTQKLLPYATLKLGYSQMFATESMEFLKSQANPSGLQNWGWAMLVIKPNLLKWKKPAAPAE